MTTRPTTAQRRLVVERAGGSCEYRLLLRISQPPRTESTK
jgi:hypothetical protein